MSDELRRMASGLPPKPPGGGGGRMLPPGKRPKDYTPVEWDQYWDEKKEIEAETVIISTGASAKWLGLEGEQKFNGSGVSACTSLGSSVVCLLLKLASSASRPYVHTVLSPSGFCSIWAQVYIGFEP